MPSIGTNSKPAYVYDSGTDTWIPIGPGEHTHDYSASAHNHDSTYIAKTLTTTTGDIIYASAANTPARLGIGSTDQVLKVSGGLPVWAAASTPNFVGVWAYGTSQIISNGATYYACQMNNEVYDTDSFHDNSTNNSRITIPSGKGGKYAISVQIAFDNANNTVGYCHAFLRKNGTGTWNIIDGAQLKATTPGGITGSNNNSIINFSGIENFSAGDYFEIIARSDNGSASSIRLTNTVIAGYLGA